MAWQKLKQVIQAQGGKLVEDKEDYLHATFTSTLFRFIDDLELSLDENNKLIHIRSASRVGHSDLGQNRKRVERLRNDFR